MKIVGTGDLEFYHIILGCVNMSSSWCFWYYRKIAEWKSKHSNYKYQPGNYWTIAEIIAHVSDCSKDEGIFLMLIWTNIDQIYYVVLLLHIFIGITNNVIENFFVFVNVRILQLNDAQLYRILQIGVAQQTLKTMTYPIKKIERRK